MKHLFTMALLAITFSSFAQQATTTNDRPINLRMNGEKKEELGPYMFLMGTAFTTIGAMMGTADKTREYRGVSNGIMIGGLAMDLTGIFLIAKKSKANRTVSLSSR